MKLIDKDALVAEIERRLRELSQLEKASYEIGLYDAYKIVLSFLDTLEVKEVDLKKAVEDHIYTHDGRKRMKLELDWEQCDLTLKGGDAIIKFAKHFFELGIKARIDKELVEEVYSHIDSINDTANRMTSGNFMHNRASIKFSANTIAKVLELMGIKAQKGENV